MGALMWQRKIGSAVAVVFVAAVGMAAVAYFASSTHGLNLVTKDLVLVYEAEVHATTWPHPAAMTELPAGRSVPVTRCIDVKHYLIYEIRLPDGRQGFVLDGNYELIRNGSVASC